jgi:hypothetical protein
MPTISLINDAGIDKAKSLPLQFGYKVAKLGLALPFATNIRLEKKFGVTNVLASIFAASLTNVKKFYSVGKRN